MWMSSALVWDITQRMVPDFLALEDGTDRLSRNVGKELQLRCVVSQKSADLSVWIVVSEKNVRILVCRELEYSTLWNTW